MLPSVFDWDRTFGRRAPRVLDFGCGEGDYLREAAGVRPDRDHLGIDLQEPLIAKARAKSKSLPNLRFLTGDALELLARLTGLDEVHVYHPQPYRHPGQAPLEGTFFERCWRALKPGGRLVLQSDVPAQARHLREAAHPWFELELLPGPWPDAPGGRTKRERLAMRKQLRITRAQGLRRDVPLDLPLPAPYRPTRRVRGT
jgi:tRNA (guanine-N7-)-methyltransferase